jgi:heat shock protein HslJ
MNKTLLTFLLCATPLLAADGPTVRYACPGGETFSVHYQPEQTTPKGARNARAVLRTEGKPKIALPHVPAASGARYSDGYTTLWSKGGEAMIESGSVNVSGCVSDQSQPSSLEGRWILSGWGDGDPVQPKGAAFVEFDPANQRAFGALGCNRFSGAADLSGSDLAFRGIASTKMACPGPAMDLESRFLLTLETTASYRITGDRLLLLDAVGKTIAELVKE